MQLRVFGGSEFSAGTDGAAEVAKQTRIVLACLALAGDKGLSRAELCDLFWPNRPTAQARNSLRQALATLRKVLGDETTSMVLQTDAETVRLHAAASSVDLHVFRVGAGSGERSSQIAAAEAFKGELLAGVSIGADVERYIDPYRHHLNQEAQRLAEKLSLFTDDAGALDASFDLANRLLRINPASEEAHRALMRVHLARGRSNAARRQYEHCRVLVRRELQAEPEIETSRLHASIHSADAPAPEVMPPEPPAARSTRSLEAESREGEVPDRSLHEATVPTASGFEAPPPVELLGLAPTEVDAEAAKPDKADTVRSGSHAPTTAKAEPPMFWFGRLNPWPPTLRSIQPRHLGVALLLVLIMGVIIVPGEGLRSALVEPLTMQAVPTVAVLTFKASDDRGSGVATAFGQEVRSELGRSTRYLDLSVSSASLSERDAGQHGVRYIVSGTILGNHDDRESVFTIQLAEVGTGRMVWSDSAALEARDGTTLNRFAARFARALAIQIRTAESRRPLPSRPMAGHYALMGHALGQDKNTASTVAQSLALFQQALSLDAQSSSALHGLAWARLVQVVNNYIPRREHATAISDAKIAIDLLLKQDPRNPATHFLRGNLFRASKQTLEAIAAYEYTLSVNPNHQWAHASLGRMLIETGQPEQAIAKIEYAISLHPMDPLNHAAYYWAGMAALHAGDYHAAVDWLLKSRLANPNYPYAMLWLAMAHCGIGDMEKAQANFAEYVTKQPVMSISSFRHGLSTTNAVVAEQRERLAGLLRKLGVEEGPLIAVRP